VQAFTASGMAEPDPRPFYAVTREAFFTGAQAWQMGPESAVRPGASSAGPPGRRGRASRGSRR
jgi:hypothetical protein